MKTIDFTGFTYDELLVVQHELTKAIQAADAQARADALEAAREAARAKGFNLETLLGATAAPASTGKTRKARAPSTTIYANPADANQTWNGRGRPPAWYAAAIAGGATQDSLRVTA